MYYYYIVFLIIFLLFQSQYIQRVINKLGIEDNDNYKPPVILENIITNEESEYILNKVKTDFVMSEICDGVNEKIRKSKTAWISKEDDTVQKIIERVSRDYGHPFENIEDLQVVKYNAGDYYNQHHDSFPYYLPDFLYQGGQRVLTILIYLNDDFEGGSTRFINLDKDIKPKRNSAVVFHPLDNENKRCHRLALHSGLPVTSGKKYIANIWIRENGFKPNYDRGLQYYYDSIIVYLYSTYSIITGWLLGKEDTF